MPLSSRLRLIGGARLEHWEFDLNTLDQQGRPAEVFRNNTDLLPALSLNYSLKENQIVRLSASQTLSRPEYRRSPTPPRSSRSAGSSSSVTLTSGGP